MGWPNSDGYDRCPRCGKWKSERALDYGEPLRCADIDDCLEHLQDRIEELEKRLDQHIEDTRLQ